jgi:hypothetical protein
VGCFWRLVKVVSVEITALVTIPPAHPSFTLLVFDVADMKISVRVGLDFDIYLRDEILWVLLRDQKQDD